MATIFSKIADRDQVAGFTSPPPSGGIKKALVLTFTVFLLASCGGGGGGDGGGGIDTSWLAQFPNTSINLPKIGEYVYDDKRDVQINVKGEMGYLECDDDNQNTYTVCASLFFDVYSWYAQYDKFIPYYNDLKNAGFTCIGSISSDEDYVFCVKSIGTDIFLAFIEYRSPPGAVHLSRAKKSAN